MPTTKDNAVPAGQLERWRHDHSFGQDRRRPGERKTQIVIAITAT
jgi:hypothetical protein